MELFVKCIFTVWIILGVSFLFSVFIPGKLGQKITSALAFTAGIIIPVFIGTLCLLGAIWGF